MPLADFLNVLDTQITPHVDTSKVMIILSGGEPLVRQDIEQIGAAICQRKYPWGMVTNGIALTEKKYAALRQVGLLSMSVSLDGLEADHIWMRRTPLAFEGACRAIKLCAADSQMTWDVVTCVTPRTINKLREVQQLLWSLGCRNWRIVNVDPMGRGSIDNQLNTDEDRILLNEQEFVYLMNFISEERQLGRHVSYGCPGFLGDFEGAVRDYFYRCAAGIEVASILCDGSISACTSIRGKYYQGNIYKDNFWEVWENRFEVYRNREWMRNQSPCNACKVWKFCQGNGMHLRTENGHLLVCHYNGIYKNSLYPHYKTMHENN